MGCRLQKPKHSDTGNKKDKKLPERERHTQAYIHRKGLTNGSQVSRKKGGKTHKDSGRQHTTHEGIIC